MDLAAELARFNPDPALANWIAYFAESDRSFRVIVTDAGMLHG